MKSLMLIFLLSFTTMTNAATICEEGLQTPARRFLRTLRVAVASGEVGPSDLAWMIQQPKPEDPLRGTERRIENLAFKDSFQREVPRINLAQWKLVVAQAQSILAQKQRDQTLVQKAQEDTRFIPALLHEFEFPRGETFQSHFVSSKGEVFFCVANASRDETFIYTLNPKRKHKITGWNINIRSHDFFETSDGKILFALNTNKEVVVHDARTGKIEMNGVPLPRGKDSAALIIFEDKGEPMIMLTEPMGRSFARVLVKINMRLAQPDPGFEIPYPAIAVRRFANNHLYAFGMRLQIANDLSSIMLHDLSDGKTLVHHEKLDATFRGHFAPVKGGPSLFTSMIPVMSSPQPMLIVQNPADKVWFTIPADTSNPLEFKNSKGLSDEQFIELGDRTVYAKVENVNNTYHLAYQDLEEGQMKFIDLGFAPGSTVHRETHFQMGSKLIYAVFEEQSDGRKILHMISPANNWRASIPTETYDKTISIFHSPADGRILMAALTPDKTWSLYQLWGPDRRTP